MDAKGERASGGGGWGSYTNYMPGFLSLIIFIAFDQTKTREGETIFFYIQPDIVENLG